MDITNLFTDQALVTKIQSRLPQLFYLAELESSRARKVGMEVGSARERIIIALLIYKFGEANVDTDISILEPEVDVKVFGNPISIKTVTSSKLAGVKIIWTVDAEKAIEFSQRYSPSCDTLLLQLIWDKWGWFYYFHQHTQVETLEAIGRQRYFKLPKAGTNPRGVEISAEALHILSIHPHCMRIPINWLRMNIDYNPYIRWLEHWQKD
jgi:hypothetical protein